MPFRHVLAVEKLAPVRAMGGASLQVELQGQALLNIANEPGSARDALIPAIGWVMNDQV